MPLLKHHLLLFLNDDGRIFRRRDSDCLEELMLLWHKVMSKYDREGIPHSNGRKFLMSF
jgi:hypothetical protein